jgi:hypothetical protein
MCNNCQNLISLQISLHTPCGIIDVIHFCRTLEHTEMASGFLLSILSPVWRAKLCSGIGIEGRHKLNLDGEEVALFPKMLDVAIGVAVTVDGLRELIGMVRMADRYQMESIQGALEEAVLNKLTVESCGGILAMSSGSGLERLERASRELALRKFDLFAQSDEYMDLGEELLGSLLEDDNLCSEREERVLEVVVRWMKVKGGAIRGEGLLRKIRFPLMATAYLTDEAREMLPENTGLDALVLEACYLKHTGSYLWAERKLRYLDAKVLLPRREKGVDWEQYASGGERRLAVGLVVTAVSPHSRTLLCGGLGDGSILVWNRATMDLERSLPGHTAKVWALLTVEGWLISGSSDSRIRVWDVAAGRCEGVLWGHSARVMSLAAMGLRLVSGSWDGTVKVWSMDGPVSAWQCEHTLDVPGEKVNCVEAWAGRAAAGLSDRSIWVWDARAGQHERTLLGHDRPVVAMVARGQRLYSSSLDGTVRAWSTETWECTLTARAFAEGSPQYIWCLAVSGAALVGGSESNPHSNAEAHEVRVWDLETLEPRHTLAQPAGKEVRWLTSDGGELWAAIGRELVVWGRRE